MPPQGKLRQRPPSETGNVAAIQKNSANSADDHQPKKEFAESHNPAPYFIATNNRLIGFTVYDLARPNITRTGEIFECNATGLLAIRWSHRYRLPNPDRAAAGAGFGRDSSQPQKLARNRNE